MFRNRIFVEAIGIKFRDVGVDPFTASMMDLSQDDLVDWYNPENGPDPLGAVRQAELAESTYGGGGKSV